MNLLSIFGNLSPNAKLGATAGGTAALMAALGLGISGHWQLLLLLALLVVMATVAFIIFRLMLAWWKKRKSRPMEKSLAGNTSSAPQQVSGAKKLADLDSLRRVFSMGVEKFRSAGKDLYSLPWYVLVGQPGSGKTEAIRHSAIGFPPGLQDQLQGAGGTINMNWWFSNHAIILDTAGRLMFEEVAAGSTSEWQEFLKLLRQHRPNCPINGMLLVIPADSLLKDSTEVIARNAGKIAQQLDNIQRSLGVRFPVFIFITKSDYLPGFSQFFDDLTDPQLQHQIMGWSNPAPLDDPFNVDAVETHLQQVRNRLAERRQRLLADPVNTEDPNGHRLDQVDSLFAFPDALLKISPRLKQYLETIFVAGEWSAKPLFLRGIYFTSSMSEGKSLDADLAAALGVAVDALPASGVWRRDRAYFLRDLFLQKIFKERGLVTRAGNAMKQQRRRKIAVLLTGFAAVAILLAATFYAFFELKNSVGNPGQYWQAAAGVYTSSSPWSAMIVPKSNAIGTPTYTYQGHKHKLLGETLAEFYAQGFDLVRKPIAVPWIFKPVAFLGGRVNTRQRQAFVKIFNAEVLSPVMVAARTKLAAAPLHQGPVNLEQLESRTRALVEIIALAHSVYQPGAAAAEFPRGRRNFDALVGYVLSPADYKSYKTYQADSVHIILKTLYRSRRTWPPGGTAGENALALTISHGIRSVVAGWNSAVGTGNQSLQQLVKMKVALQKYQASEQALIHWATGYQPGGNGKGAAVTHVTGILSSLAAAAAEIQRDLPTLGSHGTLKRAYLADAQTLLNQRRRVFRQLKRQTAWIDSLAKAPVAVGTGGTAGLLTGAVSQLRGNAGRARKKTVTELVAARANLLAHIADEKSPFGSQGQIQISELDQKFLRRADSQRQLSLREAIYLEVAALASAPKSPTSSPSSLFMLHPWLKQFNDAARQAAANIRKTDSILKNAGPAPAAVYNHQAMDAANKALRLIESSRLSQVLSSAIADAPSGVSAAETLVKNLVKKEVAAGRFTTISKPAIPFTADPDKAFDPRFNPQGAKRLLGAWHEIGDLLRLATNASSDSQYIPGGSELLAQYKRAGNVFRSYRRAYFVYWLSSFSDGLAVNKMSGINWKTYLQRMRRVRVDQLFRHLQSYGKRVSEALAAFRPPQKRAAKVQSVKNNIQSGDKLLNSELFRSSTRRRLNRWMDLSDDLDAARSRLLPRKPEKLSEYFFATPSHSNFVSDYFRPLAVDGLRILAETSQQQADNVLNYIKAHPYFPLFIPAVVVKPFQHEWLPKDITTLDGQLSALPQSSTSHPFPGLSKRVNRQLRILQGDVSYRQFGYSRATVAAIRKILAALIGNGSGRPLVCRLQITQAMKSDQAANTVQFIWPYLTVNDNGVRTGTASFRSAAAEDLGKISLPEKAGAALKLNFYETDPAMAGAKADHSLVFHGPWAVLKLLARYHGRTTHGKTWVVTITTIDQFHISRTMRMELLFSRPLPSLAAWPRAGK